HPQGAHPVRSRPDGGRRPAPRPVVRDRRADRPRAGDRRRRLPDRQQRRAVGRPDGRPSPSPPDGRPSVQLAARMRLGDRPRGWIAGPLAVIAALVVGYEFPDAAAAVDAGNEEAGYLGTGNGRVQFPPGTLHVLRELGPTLIFFSWLPAASSDPTAANVATALGTLGIGFTVPN